MATCIGRPYAQFEIIASFATLIHQMLCTLSTPALKQTHAANTPAGNIKRIALNQRAETKTCYGNLKQPGFAHMRQYKDHRPQTIKMICGLQNPSATSRSQLKESIRRSHHQIILEQPMFCIPAEPINAAAKELFTNTKPAKNNPQ